MEKRFPHMGNDGFPGVRNIDVFAYENTFDYTRWQPDVRLKLCNVPWDSSYSDVPGFEDDEARGEWFDGIEGRTVTLASETHLLPDGSVQLPLPFSVMSLYNYIAVTFPRPTGEGDPLAYADGNNRLNWYFFINEIRSLAGSTTECTLVLDNWTTFANDCFIGYMILERGHYPVAKSSVADYLANPIANNGYLLAPDVTFGEARNISSSENLIINDGTMYACIATYANAAGNWGTWHDADVPASTATVPSYSFLTQQGIPCPQIIAIEASKLQGFMTAIESQAPQFKQAVRAVFFAPSKLLNMGGTFEFCGYSLRYVNASQKSFDLLDLKKSDFGFDAKYENFAKLYTYPYSKIELANEKGEVSEVRIEDTIGSITANLALQLAFPAISIDCVFSGINGASSSVSFRNITERSFSFGGNWYATLMSWQVPVFEVFLNGGTAYDVNSEYSRTQNAANAETAYANAVRSAGVTTDNTALQVAANTTMTERSNQAATSDTYYGNELNQAIQAWNAGYSRNTVAAENDAETQQSAVSIGAGTINTVASTIGNIVSGNISGAIAGAISGVTNGVATAANTSISINLANSKVELGISNSQSQVSATNTNNAQRNEIQLDCATDNMTTQNRTSSAMAANAVNASNANAAATRSNAYAAISNARKQGHLAAPAIYGSANPGNAATRPMMVSANVVTQSKGEIAAAGDAFARYGYFLNQQVSAEKLNLMKNFTFWKASDLWLTSSKGVPVSSQEMLKSVLLNGTTVWKHPEKIGTVSVYDN